MIEAREGCCFTPGRAKYPGVLPGVGGACEQTAEQGHTPDQLLGQFDEVWQASLALQHAAFLGSEGTEKRLAVSSGGVVPLMRSQLEPFGHQTGVVGRYCHARCHRTPGSLARRVLAQSCAMLWQTCAHRWTR